MTNVKVQISNQIQMSNEMPKQVRHDKNVILDSFQNPVSKFGIHLTFACLPQAGISNFLILILFFLSFLFRMGHSFHHPKGHLFLSLGPVDPDLANLLSAIHIDIEGLES
jgi:hypothetical protein